MFFARLRTFLACFLLISTSLSSRAQSGFCPPNMDFELGDFTNWVCRAGSVAIDGSTGLNTITWTSVGPPVFDRHTIISSSFAGNDPYGGFPRICPNGSGFSALLGNATASLNGGIGREASGVSYVYTIPASVTQFSIFFHYAVVLENPGHQPEAQPRFRARIRDLTTGLNIPCVDFDFTASSNLPGFLPSPINSAVLYKDWTPVTLNLTGLAGRTIELEFIATECTQQGHFGYAYIDVNSNCNGAIQGSTICQGDDEINLTAPYGFQTYAWYSDPTFTNLLATTQNLYMNPAPSVGTVIPVIVEPYPGFGCKDTLYATITVSPKPVSNAGTDKVICKASQVQIGGPPVMGFTYEWTPSGQVSNSTISNPFAWTTSPTPEEFIVKTTDILTGCFSRDTTYVSTFRVDTLSSATGPLDFCDEQTPTILSVNTGLTSIQWYDGSTPLSGANGQTYVPTVSGNYWAQVVQGGCTDTTRTIAVNVHPLPIADFTVDDDTACVTNNSFVFTNSSTAVDGSTMTHNWKFPDGTTSQTLNANKNFPAVGTYTTELVSTTQWGCKDSTTLDVYVLPVGIPDFTWDSICLNRPVQFLNLSSENGSALVNYTWNFNDGGPGSNVKDPPPVTYTDRGRKDVTLEMITLGCEDDPQTIIKSVQVNDSHDGHRYRTITVPEGSTWNIHVRDSIGTTYAWKPQVQLTSYNTRYTQFVANGNDVEYLIDITDLHTCVTTDTILMQILKKPGFYLPTAFTPNGDGLNDVAKPYLVGMQSLKSFTVFNRWGQRIFYSTTYGEGWDGRFNGVDQDPGVYIWILEFINKDGIKQTEKGSITIIR
jgi:gliding motility-associated-like protein